MKRALVIAICASAACGEEVLRQVEPDLRLNMTEVDFGGIPVLNEATVHVLVDNIGVAPLIIGKAEVREVGSVFSVKEAPERVEAGATGTIIVAFVPPRTAPFTGTLLLDSDDPDSPFLEIPLKGEGTTVAGVEVAPTAISFGRVGEGRTALRRVKVTSTGTADLIVQDVSFVAGTAPGYGFVGSVRTPSTLKAPHDGFPGENIELNVKFSVAEGQTQTTGGLVVKSTDPYHREVRVDFTADINRAPIPLAVLTRPADARVTPGAAVRFDGSASYDPDSDAQVTFRWSLSTQPFGSQATLDADNVFNPVLTTDVAGIYEVELTVTDGEGLESLRPSRVIVQAVPPDDMFVELVWQNDRTDLDLHFRPEGAGVFTDADCYWANRRPDLGAPFDPTDDPFLRNDDLAGYGPEIMVYTRPIEGQYRMSVQLRAFNGAIIRDSPATVRIYLYGVVKAELKKTLKDAGEWWDVGTVEWPTGEVVATP